MLPRPRCSGDQLVPTSSGVFGRWRYVPSLNAFIAVSDANGNVFFYKYSAHGPTSQARMRLSPGKCLQKQESIHFA